MSAALAERRAKQLAPTPTNTNRARPTGKAQSYTIAPVSASNFEANAAAMLDHRPVGANGAEAFRKMTQKGKKRG